jgi:hypothetical protein
MASADSNIRTIQVNTAGAAQKGVEMGAELPSGPQAGGSRKQRGAGRRSNRTQKVLQVGEVTKLQAGGSQSASPGTAVQLAASHIPGPAGAPTPPAPVGVDSAATQKGAVLTVAEPPTAAPAKTGGSPAAAAAAATPVKVVLAAAKKKKPGVVLAAAVTTKPAVQAAAGGGLKKHAATTRHKARKIKVSMKTLRKKIHRAKTIRKSAEGASLEQIKKELQKAGILKEGSKAPEGILRQMYADFMTLKSRAL